MNLAKRVSKLEVARAPIHPPGIVLRFEGPGTEGLPQLDEDVDENTLVIVVRLAGRAQT